MEDYFVLALFENTVVSILLKNDDDLKEYWIASYFINAPLSELSNILSCSEMKKMIQYTKDDKLSMSELLTKLIKDLGWDMIKLDTTFISTVKNESGSTGIMLKRIVPLKEIL